MDSLSLCLKVLLDPCSDGKRYRIPNNFLLGTANFKKLLSEKILFKFIHLIYDFNEIISFGTKHIFKLLALNEKLDIFWKKKARRNF